MAVRDYVARFLADVTGYQLDKAERDTENLERTVDDTADKVARDWRDMANASERAARDMGDAARKGGDDVKGKLRGTGSEIGAEFSENIGEAFRGGDLRDTFLETLTSLGPALGGVGLALGAGAALINGMIQGVEQEAEKLRQATKDAYTSAIDAVYGGKGARTIGDIVGDLSPEDIQLVKDAGLTVGEFAVAVQEAEEGDPAKLDTITGALEKRAGALDELKRETKGYLGIGARKVADEAAGSQELLDLIERGNTAYRDRAAAVRDLTAAVASADIDRLRELGAAQNALGRDPDYQRGRR